MTNKTWNKYFISPQKFHDDIIELCNLIPKNKFKYVLGIPRGGSIIAVYVSHHCNLAYIEHGNIICVDDLDEILVVDDLVDTGRTWNVDYFEHKLDCFATLYYKPRSIVKPTYYVEEFKNSDWLVFPFEKPDEIPNREV